ncbi:hypothetical protein Back2_19600 [Nocardioides baekrokdamisoli]|uniref:Uncharacterized protein n=1 Tax=Nocardioides baekrokdamisoli TaxID=1804624 RepID=A0A3G9IZ60_9ACTN|nr:hypothetical protein [Nocardioides baekrokdamisoli]BBH17673.1 hypothetical protein Back2_19600 [Nocardioides baekrokdamisoli]
MEQSDSDKLQPPSLDGVFARKRREREEREANPQWVEPYAAPAPPAPQPTPPPVAAPPIVPTPPPVPAPVPDAEPAAAAPEEQPESVQPAPVAIEPSPVAAEEVEEDHGQRASESAVLARVSEEPQDIRESVRASREKVAKPAKESKAPKAAKEPKPAKEPKAPKAPKPEKAARTRRIPAFIPTSIAGACSGGVLVGLVAAFNRWGGQTDSINALELLGAFVAAIVAGFILLVLSRVKHGAAISFLGVGLVAVVLMFFPSDRWQTLTGGIIVVVATAVAYVAAHRIAREATSD